MQQTTPENIGREKGQRLVIENLPSYEYKQKEICVYNKGQKIYGIAYIPDTGRERIPLIICAHGLGGSHSSSTAHYARQLAPCGVAVYCFDFCGGGGTASDGETTQMSVMTEVADLEAVIEKAKQWDFVDTERIVLLGTSQGGAVAAITAARHVQDVAGLVLMYPGFVISDIVHEMFPSRQEIPDTFPFHWIMAGRPYADDMWDYDVYKEIGSYKKKVLLLHGNKDTVVPISYSERAAATYEDVAYYVIDGAEHGFTDDAFDESVRRIADYLQEIRMIM